jgi:methyl-coenzyme M reductase subunit D
MSRFNKPISQISNEKKLVQIELFPQRVLNIETAQRLLNELNEIEGITRMVVFGPRLPKDNPDDLLEGKYNVAEKKYLNIKGEMVELTVQIGRLWIEINDMAAVEKIKAAGEKTLPFSFEMYEGVYIRTQKTVTDYARKGGKVDSISMGMMDPKAKTGPACCGKTQHVE